jgi:hypothetical protein
VLRNALTAQPGRGKEASQRRLELVEESAANPTDNPADFGI